MGPVLHVSAKEQSEHMWPSHHSSPIAPEVDAAHHAAKQRAQPCPLGFPAPGSLLHRCGSCPHMEPLAGFHRPGKGAARVVVAASPPPVLLALALLPLLPQPSPPALLLAAPLLMR